MQFSSAIILQNHLSARTFSIGTTLLLSEFGISIKNMPGEFSEDSDLYRQLIIPFDTLWIPGSICACLLVKRLIWTTVQMHAMISLTLGPNITGEFEGLVWLHWLSFILLELWLFTSDSFLSLCYLFLVFSPCDKFLVLFDAVTARSSDGELRSVSDTVWKKPPFVPAVPLLCAL